MVFYISYSFSLLNIFHLGLKNKKKEEIILTVHNRQSHDLILPSIHRRAVSFFPFLFL